MGNSGSGGNRQSGGGCAEGPGDVVPDLEERAFIYDWNEAERRGRVFPTRILVHDETLRDGIQSPSVVDPHIDAKLKLVHLLAGMGVDSMNIGLPGAGPRALEDVTRLAGEIRDARLGIEPCCAARTHLNDLRPIVDISQKLGMPIRAMTFIGSSPIRLYAEDWDMDLMLRRTAESIDFAVKNGLPVTYVTEDTTRARPEVLAHLFRCAIEHGADRLALCDTVGHVTPDGTRNLINFTRSIVAGMGAKIGIDWHGHNDRGLAVTNALYALENGADCVHGTVLGIGERVGNASLDQILVNLHLFGALPGRDLSKLVETCRVVSEATRVPIPVSYPLAGPDAFRTATGVHAAAIIKAEKKGHAYLADRIYSGVPAGLFGREQEIEIGPMSGESNVIFWLQKRGFVPEPGLARYVLDAAKRTDHLLSEAEVRALIEEYGRAAASSATLPVRPSNTGTTA